MALHVAKRTPISKVTGIGRPADKRASHALPRRNMGTAWETEMSRHGGARRGAGRPRKYDFWQMVGIGQACEMRWRVASKVVMDARLAALPLAKEIRRRQECVNAIPVPERKTWLASPDYEDHSAEIESLLHKRAGNHVIGGVEVEEETYGGDYEGGAPRVMHISTRPPRGTRKQIVAEISEQFDLPESTIDNLWQEYRRFERELAESQDSAET
jgi:hypothetical protein